MSLNDNSGDSATALAAAADWHARLRADDVSAEAFQAFETWVSIPGHRAAYDQIDLAWGAAGDHEAAFADAPQVRGRRSWALPATLAAAAAALVLVVLGINRVHWTPYDGSPNAARSIELADGSTIVLNRHAHAEVALTGDIRRVRLSGEAAFEVSHDPQRPFVINAGDQQIRVVGTEFNVLDDHGALSVTVRRGIVQVGPSGGDAVALLHANESGLHQIGHASWRVTPADADAALAWKMGRLIYRDAPLAAVVQDLNRYFDKPVRLADPSLANLRFSGTLKIDSQQQVLDLLQLFLPLSVNSSDAEIVLHRRT